MIIAPTTAKQKPVGAEVTDLTMAKPVRMPSIVPIAPTKEIRLVFKQPEPEAKPEPEAEPEPETEPEVEAEVEAELEAATPTTEDAPPKLILNPYLEPRMENPYRQTAARCGVCAAGPGVSGL